jgi:hypothetical protein
MKNRKEQYEGFLDYEAIIGLENLNITLDRIDELEDDEIGCFLGFNARVGGVIRTYASYLPRVEVEWDLKPIA